MILGGWFILDLPTLYPFWYTSIAMKLTCLWKITVYMIQINYQWQFSMATLNYQRPEGNIWDMSSLDVNGINP